MVILKGPILTYKHTLLITDTPTRFFFTQEELRVRVDRSDPDDLERFLKEKAIILPEQNSLAREVRMNYETVIWFDLFLAAKMPNSFTS
jgi:hypothetical protein